MLDTMIWFLPGSGFRAVSADSSDSKPRGINAAALAGSIWMFLFI